MQDVNQYIVLQDNLDLPDAHFDLAADALPNLHDNARGSGILL